jgi:isoleucyl-tRNA synthetase
VTLEGRAPYKTVFSYEKVYDEKGKPMHKSAGNAIWFDDAVERMGADVMRWLYCAFNPNNNLRFGYSVADELRRRIITLWNVYGFFVTYARIDGFTPESGDLAATLGKSPNPLDRWILSALYKTVDEITTGLEEYDVAASVRSADAFLDALSTWYLRRSRRRFWKSSADEDKKFAYRTLFHVLVTYAEALAPVIPFVTEEIYRNLTTALRGEDAWPESVHLRPWPEVRRDLIDAELNARMDAVLASVSLGRAAREKVQIKVRQPLARMWLLYLDGKERGLDGELLSQIGQELNLKEVLLGGRMEDLVTPEIKLNFPVLGSRLGPAMKEVARAAKEGRWTLDGDGTLKISGQSLVPGEFELQYAPREGKTAAHNREILVVMDTTITEDLRCEGYARELVRAVQDLRKQAGYEVDDRIVLFFDSEDARIRETFAANGDYVREETLSADLQAGRSEVDQSADLELESGCSVWVGIRRHRAG